MKPLPDAEQPAESSAAVAETKLLQDAVVLWDELRTLGHAHFRLAALETQRAGLSLVTMLVAGIMLAVLCNVLWFGLMAVLVIGLLENGFSLNNALLLAVACSLLLMLILIGFIRHASHYLRYPLTANSLQPKSSRALT
jgi:hypothetical protein